MDISVHIFVSTRDDPSIVNITDEMTKASFGNVFQGLNQENAKKDMTSKRFDHHFFLYAHSWINIDICNRCFETVSLAMH